MVLLQLTDQLELFVKRREYNFCLNLSHRDMTEAVERDIKPHSFLHCQSTYVGALWYKIPSTDTGPCQSTDQESTLRSGLQECL